MLLVNTLLAVDFLKLPQNCIKSSQKQLFFLHDGFIILVSIS